MSSAVTAPPSGSRRSSPALESGALRARLLGRLLLDGLVPPEGELARAGLRPDSGGLHHCLAADPAGPAAHPARQPPWSRDGWPGSAPGRPPRRRSAPAPWWCSRRPLPRRNCARCTGCASGRWTSGGTRAGEGLYDLTDLAAEIALAEQPLLGALVSRRLLAGLDPADGFHRQLAVTALTYLDSGRRLDQTASALFTHPNTVR